jgi:Protein kinase domain
MQTSCISRSERNNNWQQLCSRYLPLIAEGPWRFSRAATPEDLEQGWKLHVSATILNAGETLLRVVPLLLERDVQFKALNSLEEINKINSGIHYPYSQIGKIITIYPRSSEEAVNLARLLSEATNDLVAPAVPFEERFGPAGCIYYRYGSFRPLDLERPDGSLIPAIRTPEGNLIIDDRNASDFTPDWTSNPFSTQVVASTSDVDAGPLASRYRAFRALTQRGRGGVYQALDIGPTPPRFCLLKEGRAAGEMSWDGRDGVWRVKNEQRVIESLRGKGVDAPEVYDSFEDENNSYLVLEFIEGTTLHQSLTKRQRRLSLAQCLRLGIRVAELLGRIHEAGWVWRDCKTSNIMVTKNGNLRPIDFEGACQFDRPDNQPWGTPGFTPPWYPALESRVHEDLYALGSILYFLFTGRLPIEEPVPQVNSLRANAPSEACRTIGQLLTGDRSQQPSANEVARRLTALQHSSSRSSALKPVRPHLSFGSRDSSVPQVRQNADRP